MSQLPVSLYDRMGGRPVLDDLLRHFYAEVRQHEEIGSLFAAHVADWTGGPANYDGPMPFKHLHLRLEERHFQAWLGLWHHHCRAHLVNPERGQSREGQASEIRYSKNNVNLNSEA